MICLAIDTSGPLASVAVINSFGKIFEQDNADRLPGLSHSEDLVRLVQASLTLSEVKPSELEQLVIGSGPGSFTGLRISYSFVKGLSLALNLPLIGVSSLKAYAFSQLEHAEYVASLSDARRGQFFYGLYRRCVGSTAIEVVTPPCILNEDEIVSDIEINNGLSLEQVSIVGYQAPDRVSRFEICQPSQIATALIRLGEQTNFGPFELGYLSDMEPDYLRGINAKTIEERRG
ncbi:MAG: tRNA (adenosine(37)-N6)-threonylcarbamoyltransferase complex dimerization subunit type 1 TsaB [Deltaproteobacteria bacterium]|nr:tRNA (adenosine(37)-N6)-threonylcarbamoyltransferase complex dimerization subunit type 1 TsaB [Deltaproteobacteria bacterium]